MEVPVTFSNAPSVKESLRIVNQVSEGKFGIYQVFSPLHRTNYALKVFPKDSFGDKQYKKEKLMTNLDHPNIIKSVKARCHIPNYHSILTEFASNGDFFDIVTKGCLSNEVLVRTFFHQLIEGLEYLHSQELAHLDLKLENIMLDSNYQLKIIDFDQAQCTKDKRITSGGTVGYRAPEVQNGTCTHLSAADIFSAGIMLFCFKSREFPFHEKEDPTAKDIRCYSTFMKNNRAFWRGKAEAKQDMSFFSQDFIELINGMLEKDVSKRFTIKDIKNSRWYKGLTLDTKNLKFEMSMKLKMIRENSK